MYVWICARLLRVRARSNIWPAHDLGDKYRLVKDDGKAQELWAWWFGTLLDHCLHGPNCQHKMVGAG